MSQEKVTRYKEEKANRKSIMKKKKIKKAFGYSIAILVAVVFVGLLGVSVVREVDNVRNANRKSVEVDYAAISGFESEIAKAEEEKETEKESTETTEPTDEKADTTAE